MTWYVTDKREYLARRRARSAPAYRERDRQLRRGDDRGAGGRADRGPGQGGDRGHRGRAGLRRPPWHASAHVDTFARDRLPPPADAARVPVRAARAAVSRAAELRRRAARRGASRRAGASGACLIAPRRPALDLRRPAARRPTASPTCWSTTWAWCPATACCCARRTTPMLAACWFAVMKAGGIAVATMPMLRAKELAQIIDKAAGHARAVRCRAAGRARRRARSARCCARCPSAATRPSGLEAPWRATTHLSTRCDTAADDVCLLAFTSGTTGLPKATMHFHRDVMASLPVLPAACAARRGRRCVHRQPAAGLHLRPRRPAAVPDERGCVHRAARARPRRPTC